MGYRLYSMPLKANHPDIEFKRFDGAKVYYGVDPLIEAISFIEEYLEREEESLGGVVEFVGEEDLFQVFFDPEFVRQTFTEEEIIKLEELEEEEHINFTAYLITKSWRNWEELKKYENNYVFEQW